MSMNAGYNDPLLLTGENTLEDFCRWALRSGPSKNALSNITKVELLKDSRVKEHWRHEYLVFTVSPQNGSALHALYFERGLNEDKTWFSFICSGFTGKASDTLMFCEAGGEEDKDRRSWSNSILEVTLKPSQTGPLRLRHLAQLLDSESYHKKYPRYGLHSANCWAWARGFLFDVIRHERSSASEVLIFRSNSSALRRGNESSPEMAMEKEELELCLLTEYGAYGRALLHFTSDDFRTRYPWYIISRHTVRVILLLYSIIDAFTELRLYFHHATHSNWTTCLRRMTISTTKTTNEKGWDFTSTFLPPNFQKLVPSVPAFQDSSIPNSLCQPGRYLYLLSSPLVASTRGASSVHIYVFGCLSQPKAASLGSHTEVRPRKDSQEHKPDLSNQWLSCAIIIRPSINRHSIRDIGEIFNLEITPRIWHNSTNDLHYSAMYTFPPTHRMTQSLRDGDAIALWAHAYEDTVHKPRIALVKIVAHKPFGILDMLLIVYLAWEANEYMSTGASWRAVRGMAMCIPYATGSLFEGWVWSNIGIFARYLHNVLASRTLRK